jgi:predicted RNase H-like HicB family nuclease
MPVFRVLYTKTRRGEWSASVRGLRRCTGRGRTIREARARLRAALALAVEAAFPLDLLEDVRLPAPSRALLVRHWRAKKRLQAEQSRADEAALRACDALLAHRVSLRDASDLLGIPANRLRALRPAAGRRGRRRATAAR